MEKLILFIIAMILLTVAGIWMIRRQAKNQNAQPPKQNAQAEQRAISRKLKRHGWRVLENVNLPAKNENLEVSQIVIGPFGVIVVESRGYAGEVYVNQNDKQWVHTNGTQREHFSNLLIKVAKDAAALQRLFAKMEIYRVEIHQLVIFPKRNLELYCPADLPILTVKQLKKELRKPKYRTDRGVDIEKIYSVLKHPPANN